MIKPIHFGDRLIAPGEAVVVIAEIGVNHEGDVTVCASMIEEAAKSGADSIKLQTIDADENYVRGTPSHDLFSTCALSREETSRMFDLSRSLGMEPFTTAGDAATLEWVDALHPAAHKISSGLLTNHEIVGHAARTGRPLLISTGMAGTSDIDATLSAARRIDGTEIGIFQCTSIYPAPPETLHLAAIGMLEERYDVPCGFSDHSEGVAAAPLAVAAGACMIEKHFTFDKTRPSFDHALSLLPGEFAAMTKAIRQAEAMMGSADKVLSKTESENRARAHRCLVARGDIEKGQLFTSENVGLKRPIPDQRGLEPNRYSEVLGKTAMRSLWRDDPITEADVSD